MMNDAINNFAKQFRFKPKIENKQNFKKKKKIIVCGMGGSHLAADLLRDLNPALDLTIHSDYGLPPVDEKEIKKTLVIASSYSGNTEEVIDGFNKALEQKLNLLVIATGGKLIELAQQNDVPYIQLPDTCIQPRSALGLSLKAMLKATGQRELFKEVETIAKILKPKTLEQAGKDLATALKGKVPVIYASTANQSTAYNWKIKLNETGKIPAFYNVIPELNHNEMTGFDIKDSSRELSEKFYFILLKDSTDHPRNIKRLEVTQKLYQDRGLSVKTIEMAGESKVEKIFSSLVLADWTAFHIAEMYGLESEQVPMVEEFKKLVTE